MVILPWMLLDIDNTTKYGVYVKRQQCLLATHNCLVFWQQNIIGEMATNTSLVFRQHSIIVKATGICYYKRQQMIDWF